MPFAAEWIRDKILAPGALAAMNDEGRGITLAQVETGCRPGELCNIAPGDIFLDDEVPYIHVRARTDPDDTRAIKTEQSDRKIPLVGVALEAFKRHPKGFPRYKDKEDSYSAMANKYFKEHGLKPSPQHSVYSLRRAFEDRMLEGGVDLELREVLMGHKLDRPLYGEKGTLRFRQKVLGAIAFDFDPAIV
ncbi:tyrosine-type recombinase/integrase [Mesorhizobium sp. B2-4-17]|uniref:tyrosine-type recombinase/integrase n=1 Tax=Mesorhizobium sp. B2-4-17 TaxID=2589932 RepID=UPI0015E470B3|nr:tyrosine-type recombinase/integrase [Mesorhizobium sp. B2-4-17]